MSTQQAIVEVLTDIFQRADMECDHLRRNCQTQGQWRNVMLLAKQGLRAARAPIPETAQQRAAQRCKTAAIAKATGSAA